MNTTFVPSASRDEGVGESQRTEMIRREGELPTLWARGRFRQHDPCVVEHAADREVEGGDLRGSLACAEDVAEVGDHWCGDSSDVFDLTLDSGEPVSVPAD